MLVLGIDVGSTAVKAALVTDQGEVEHVARVPYPGTRATRSGEFDVALWWSTVATAVHRLPVSLQDIGAIGLSSLCPGLVLFDRRGGVVRPAVLFNDTRSQALRERIAASRPVDVAAAVANPVAPGVCALLALAWLAENEPASLRSTTRIGLVGTYLAHQLTREWAIDPTQASYTGAARVTGEPEWLTSWFLTVGLDPALLPPIRPSDGIIGELAPQAAAALGLRAGVPVVLGSADSAASAVAVDLAEDRELMYSLGGTHVVTRRRSGPPVQDGFMHRHHALSGSWLSHGALAAAPALSWAADVLQLDGATAHERMDALFTVARHAPPGAGGVTFLSHVAPERGPFWVEEPRAGWEGITADTGTAELARSVLEGIAFAVRLMVEASGGGDDDAPILVVGEGARDDMVMQLSADVLGRPVIRLAARHAAVQGAALLAVSAVLGNRPTVPRAGQVFDPGPSSASLDEGFQRFIRMRERQGLRLPTGHPGTRARHDREDS